MSRFLVWLVAAGIAAGQPAEQAWDHVLAVAASGRPEASKELQRLADETEHKDAALLARRIMTLWDERKGTYYLKGAIALTQSCLDEKTARRLQGPTATHVLVRATIDARGLPIEMKVAGSDPSTELRRAIVSRLRRERFIPAKPGSEFVASEVIITCRLE